MSTAKEHYDQHLAHFYSWMTGDFDTRCAEFHDFLRQQDLAPKSTGLAIDLGAAHGIQAKALAQNGFQVLAIDFNSALLEELHQHTQDLPIETLCDDIREYSLFKDRKPEFLLCCGDTLTHFDEIKEVKEFLKTCSTQLPKGGQLLLSFRDYSVPMTGTERFIPVKSDDSRILTCFLEYAEKR